MIIDTTKDLVDKAKFRLDIGNPPGKNGSLGDAINWESLVDKVPSDEDVHFITDDNDYYSALEEHKVKPFLLREWQDKKSGNICCYRRLSTFFSDFYLI